MMVCRTLVSAKADLEHIFPLINRYRLLLQCIYKEHNLHGYADQCVLSTNNLVSSAYTLYST